MQCRILLTRVSIAPLFQTTWHLSLHYFISETNEYPAFLIQKSNQKIYQVCVHPKEASEKMDGSRAPYLVFFLLTRRRLSDGSAPYMWLSPFLWLFEWLFWPTRRRLSDGYENIRRLTDVCGHIYKKKYIFVIFCRFKRKNSRAVGSNRRILDRNVVVIPPNHGLVCSSISQHHCHLWDGHDFHKELGNNRLTHNQIKHT